MTDVKKTLLILTMLLAGCLGDASLPMIASTPIPGTKLTVDLGGPDRKGQYHYFVILPNSKFTHRCLGNLPNDRLMPVVVQSVSDGVFRIQWGTERNSPYVVIDVTNSRILEDSNKSNPTITPLFEKER